MAWFRGSTLGLSTSEENKTAYLDYLGRCALGDLLGEKWMAQEFDRELGIGAYHEKRNQGSNEPQQINPEGIFEKLLRFFDFAVNSSSDDPDFPI